MTAILGLTLALALTFCVHVKADVVHVWLFAGQSNMEGYGVTVQLAPVPKWAQNPTDGWEGHPLWSSDDHTIFPTPASLGLNIPYSNGYDPLSLIRQFGAGSGFGPEISLTELIQQANPTWNMAVVKVGIGGTSLSGDWNPNLSNNSYTTFIQHVQAMDAYLRGLGHTPVYEGLIWWQGEASLKTWDYLNPIPAYGAPLDPVNGQRYEDYLYRFILAVRRDVGTISQNTQTNLPIVIYRISNSMMAPNIIDPLVIPNNPLNSFLVLVGTVIERRNEQVFVADTIPNCIWADTDNLPVLQQGNPAWWYHFTGDGYLAAGQRGFAALSILKGWQGINPAPSSVSAQAEYSSVAIAWNGISAAYNLKRATVSGGPYTTIASATTAMTYTDSAVNNGTRYYYVVSGLDSFGNESANSHETSAIPVLPQAALANVLLTASTVHGGYSTTGTVTLTIPAPAGGTTVNLSTDTPSLASVPATLTVPAGQASATFPVNTQVPAVDTQVNVIASYGGQTVSAPLTVQAAGAPITLALSLSPGDQSGGFNVTGTVTLNAVAPSGGLTINLTSNTPSIVSVPATVTVAAGATSATFTASTQPVDALTNVTLVAKAAGQSASAILQVRAPYQTNFTVSPTSVKGGGASVGTVTLSSPAGPSGVVINLTSANSAVASVPASITIKAGASSGTFTISTSSVAANTSVNISATMAGTTRPGTASLTVTP
jgi:hypothetical protein